MKRFVCVLILISVFGVSGCQPSEERSTSQSVISTAKTVDSALRSGAAIEVMEKEIELGDIGVEEDEFVGRIFSLMSAVRHCGFVEDYDWS